MLQNLIRIPDLVFSKLLTVNPIYYKCRLPEKRSRHLSKTIQNLLTNRVSRQRKVARKNAKTKPNFEQIFFAPTISVEAVFCLL